MLKSIILLSSSDDSQQEPAVPVTVPSIDEFPTLRESSATSQNVSQQRGPWVTDPMRRIHSSDDFPALSNAATNALNTNTSQTRGKWREQQQQQQQQQQITALSSTSLNTIPKKVPPPTANGIAPVNMNEDFPALKGSRHANTPTPVSMFSTWSTAKKSAKHTSGKYKSFS